MYILTVCQKRRRAEGGIMKYTKLGKTELTVSKVCMGCMGFGDPAKGQHHWTLDEEASAEIIRRGLENGINFFDTAAGYQGGTSEQYLGSALRKYAERDRVVVATKVMPPSSEQLPAGISFREYVRQKIDRSLANLGMDYVDLYILHKWAGDMDIREVMEALNETVTSGKARYIGISNCYAWQIAKANAAAEKYGLAKFVSVQGHYNLIFREEEREMVPYCRSEGIALTPYSALAAGRLCRLPGETTKRLESDLYARGKYDATREEDDKIIRRVYEIAEKHGVSMTEVALAWVMKKTDAPVAGMTKPSQVDGAVKAAELALSEEDMKYLEELYVPHRLVGVMAE